MRFGPIGDLLRWLLDLIYNFVPNYGIAVVLFTLVIRILLMPLDVRSKRSMARMNAVQPQLKAINKKYANDKEKLQQKTQELYKKEKINPLSGCLPMLIQMPILFAMFAVMRELGNEETVNIVLNIKTQLEAGISDFFPNFQSFLWIKNVFQPDSFMSTVLPLAGDELGGIGASGLMTAEMIESARAFLATPLYADWAAAAGNNIIYSGQLLFWTISIPQVFNGLLILPVLAGLTQFLTTMLMPTAQAAEGDSANPSGSTQKMMKYFFPLFSVFICLSSTAGFALYWVASNLIQAAQQYGIGKWIAYSDKKKLSGEEAEKS